MNSFEIPWTQTKYADNHNIDLAVKLRVEDEDLWIYEEK